jgi:carboxypeptidase C (cathepsin A)
VGPGEFRKQLLADEKRILGRFDARITGYDPSPAADSPDFDPSAPEYIALYTTTFNDYVRRILKYENDIQYEVLSNRVQPWNYGPGGGGHLNVGPELRNAMIRNPHMKLMVVSGYFDLATPYFAADYTVDQMTMSKELRGKITQTYYMGGHMMYHNRPALAQLKADVKAFVEGPKAPSAAP